MEVMSAYNASTFVRVAGTTRAELDRGQVLRRASSQRAPRKT